MEGRVGTICAYLSEADVFADVGCDHGFMAKYMLENGLCRRAYISDVSEKSLQKAKALLSREIEAGRCIPVVADGLKGLKEPCDLLLIAGLGGEETVRILTESYLPQKFVFQPMKNAEKLRAYLVEKGAGIEHDLTFKEGAYFYDLIAGSSRGGSKYTQKQILWGRDNLLRPAPPFFEKLESERNKILTYLAQDVSEKSREELLSRMQALDEVLNETRRTFESRG